MTKSQVPSTKSQTNHKFEIQNLKRFWSFEFGILKLFVICILLFGILGIKDANAGTILQRPLYFGLTNGLVGSWSFDAPDMAGNIAYDRSGQGNNGTLTNGPARAPGKVGQALNFDGSNDYVTMGDVLDFERTDPFSISVWYKANFISPTAQYRIIAKQNNAGVYEGYGLQIRGDVTNDPFRFALNNNSGSNQIQVDWPRPNNTNWHHVVLTYTGSSVASGMQGYVDGVAQTMTVVTDNLTATTLTTRPFNIGSWDNGGSSWFDGLIDEVRVYNRALSPDEIKRLYNMGATTKFNVSKKQDAALDNGLVGLWTFDAPDMAGVTAYDRSGNNNTGTLEGAITRASGRIGQGISKGAGTQVNAGSGTSLDNIQFLTVSMWLYPTSFPTTCGGDTTIITKVGWVLEFRCGASGQLEFTVNRASDTRRTASANSLLINAWQNVVVTFASSTVQFDDTDIHMYVNGEEISYSAALSGSGARVDDSASTLDIGGNDTASGDFAGRMDEVRVYNRVLSADEIKRLYNMGATTKFNVSKKQDAALNNGLVGLWTFDAPDMAGVAAYDRSGQNNTGTLTNGPMRQIGKIGQALNFDGVDDVVTLGTGIRPVLPVTISAWINPRAVTNKKGIFSTDRLSSSVHSGIYLSTGIIGAQGNLEVTYGSNTACDASGRQTKTGSTALPLNTWTHVVAVVRGAANISLYLNGVDDSGSYTGTGGGLVYSGESGTIGELFDCFDGDNKAFPGLIDEVRVYNRALSPDEIRRLYNMGR